LRHAHKKSYKHVVSGKHIKSIVYAAAADDDDDDDDKGDAAVDAYYGKKILITFDNDLECR
jgi:hypothetical protein